MEAVEGEDDEEDPVAVFLRAAAGILEEAVLDGVGASWHLPEEPVHEVNVGGGDAAVPAVPRVACRILDGGGHLVGHVQRQQVHTAGCGARR